MTDIDLQPHLQCPCVTLRPLERSDWEALYAVASDQEIWALHPAGDRWQEPVFRRFFEEALTNGGALVAMDTASRAIIGSSRYERSRAGPDEIEIGWTFLARDRWGGPANAAMKRLMIGHIRQHFQRVIFLIGEHNLRSRRAVEKLGATLTDRVDEADFGGVRVRHVVYALDPLLFAERPPVA